MNVKRLFVGAAGLLLLTACELELQGPKERETKQTPEGKAAVTIAINADNSRIALPEAALTDADRWELWGKQSSQSGSETKLGEWDSSATGTVYLEPGEWDFTLKGFTAQGSEILQGALANQTISLVGPNVLSFTVAPVLEGDGTFAITIELPAGHGITEVEAYIDDVLQTDAVPPSGSALAYTKTDYDAGNYLVSIHLFRGAVRYGVVSELVQAWQNLSSPKTFILGLGT
jgi:hypothetical protein